SSANRSRPSLTASSCLLLLIQLLLETNGTLMDATPEPATSGHRRAIPAQPRKGLRPERGRQPTADCQTSRTPLRCLNEMARSSRASGGGAPVGLLLESYGLPGTWLQHTSTNGGCVRNMFRQSSIPGE